MKIYTIIAGVNGAGKSSLTGALKAERNDLGQIIDVDKITASLGGRAIEGGKVAIHKINDCMERGISFTQETTLSGVRTEKTIQRAKEAGYYIRLYYIALFDNENGFGEVAEYTNGELIFKGNYRPGWLLELAKVLEKWSGTSRHKKSRPVLADGLN